MTLLSLRPRPNRMVRVDGPGATLAVIVLVIGVATMIAAHAATGPSWYGAAAGVLVGWKLLLSLLPQRRPRAGRPVLRTAAVVPFFNEDPDILVRALDSIASSTVRPTRLWIVDDGSTDPAAGRAASEWAERQHASGWTSPVIVTLAGNAGKRAAMGAAFKALEGLVEVWVCVDSDTVLEPDAIERGLEAFADPKVTAATGVVLALNPRSSWLARLIDVRYSNAFLMERAAYSHLGSVLCCCGSLAFWRADVIREGLDDFLTQRFLGRPAVAGDDRHLTNLALRRGRVVLVTGSVARTAVPERLSHFVRQQVRWSKSFVRESLWTLTHLPPWRVAWWLAIIEFVSWGAFTAALLWSLVVHPLTGDVPPASWVAWLVLAAWARSVHVLTIRRPDVPRSHQLAALALAPAYGVLHVVLLLPLRLYAMVTMTRNGWGTRKTVEVRGSRA